MKDYTRNIVAPYFLDYDHIPETNYKRDKRFSNDEFSVLGLSKSDVITKSLSDYKQSVFIINVLRQKIRILEGQNVQYIELRLMMHSLLKQIKEELDD